MKNLTKICSDLSMFEFQLHDYDVDQYSDFLEELELMGFWLINIQKRRGANDECKGKNRICN